MSDRPALAELRLGDPPEPWRALGFDVRPDGECVVGGIRLRLGAGGEPRIAGWSVRGLNAGSLDGLETTAPAPGSPAAQQHPNGAVALDHVVVSTPDFDRTLAALAAAGLELRRTRDAGRTARQGFYVLGGALLEVVGPRTPDGDGPARFWGLTVAVADLDALATRLGPLLARPRDAVQPGRRIAPVRRQAGLGPALAFMTPRAPGGAES